MQLHIRMNNKNLKCEETRVGIVLASAHFIAF